MDKQAILKYSLAFGLGFFVFYKAILPGWNSVHSDFANYYVSAKLIQTRSNLDSLYNDLWFHEQAVSLGVLEAVKFSPFPPVTAFVLVPLTLFDVETANRIWIIVNVLIFFPAVIILRKITLWSSPRCILFVLASGLSLINNIKFGQQYWVMTIALLYSFYWAEQKRQTLSGLILGVFTSIKYFPIIFIAGHFFAKRYKTVVFSLLAIGLLFFLQVYFFGLTVMREYFTVALMPHLRGHLSSQNSSAFEFQSWESLLTNLLTNSNPPSGSIPKDIAKWIVHFAFVSPLILIFYECRGKLLSERLSRSVYFALPALAALALLPASATYHYILLLIPVGIILSDSILSNKESQFVLFVYLCIGFIPYRLFFQLGKSFFLPLAYPRLWLLALLYFFVVYVIIQRLRDHKPIISNEK